MTERLIPGAAQAGWRWWRWSVREAIFTLKNRATIYAFEALQKLKVTIPKRVALIGFDDFELASTLQPSITVIQQPIEDIGRIAGEMMFDQLFDGKRGLRRSSWTRAWCCSRPVAACRRRSR